MTAEMTIAAKPHCVNSIEDILIDKLNAETTLFKLTKFNDELDRKKYNFICTWGISVKIGVRKRRAAPTRRNTTTPKRPDFAPLSLLTADLENEPVEGTGKVR